MLPSFSIKGCEHRSLAYGESRGDFTEQKAVCPHRSNLANSSFGQFGIKTILSSGKLSLLHAIFNIFKASSKPKVRRVYAQGIVSSRAIVTNAQTPWDWPIVQDPRIAMRGCSAPFWPELSIAANGYWTLPQPAGWRFNNATPKPCYSVRLAGQRTKVLSGSGSFGGFTIESSATGETFDLHMESSVSCAARLAARTAQSHSCLERAPA